MSDMSEETKTQMIVLNNAKEAAEKVRRERLSESCMSYDQQ